MDLNIVFLLGRILFGGFFIYSGINHFIGMTGSVAYAKSKGVPLPKTAVIFTGVLLILGGLSFLLDSFVFAGGVLLILFLLFTSLMMHAFWNISDPSTRAMEMTNFNKNIALLGAILIILFLY